MTIAAATTTADRRAQLADHLRVPLFRNAYALVLSSAITSAFGAVYWIVAARRYPAAEVGLDAAAISAFMLLAGVAQLNLSSALVRFIPTSGAGSKSLILRSYVTTGGLAAASGLVFAIFVRSFAPKLGFLSRPVDAIWFTAATVAWCVFVLQDAALTGLRRATWVPIENAAYAIAKLVLLAALATVQLDHSVMGSWTAALVVSVVPTNVLIFRRLLPAHASTSATTATPSLISIAAFVVPDYIGSLFWLAGTALVPLMVVEQTGPVANAYFSTAWVIAFTLYLVSINMGSSLVAEAAAQPDQLTMYTRRILRRTAQVVVPAAAAYIVGARALLSLFGSRYAEAGTTPLRLLALSAVPNVVNALVVSVARAERRTRTVVLVNAALCCSVLPLGSVLLSRFGISGVAAAWLISQTAVALLVSLPRLRRILRTDPDVSPPKPRSGLERRRTAVAQELLGQLDGSGVATRRDWTARRAFSTVADTIVLEIGPPGGPALAVLKVATSPPAGRSLAHHRSTVAGLRADPRLVDWSSCVPAVLASGESAGKVWVAEERVAGVDGRRLLGSEQPIHRYAAECIRELHAATAAPGRADDALLARLVDQPVDHLLALGGRSRTAASQRLAERLRNALAGTPVRRGWTHGDFWPGNVIHDPASGAVVGLVDWELADGDGLVDTDLVHYLLSVRAARSLCDHGAVVVGLLTGDGWGRPELDFLGAAGAAETVLDGEVHTLVLLAWLHHVAGNLSKSARYGRKPYWVRQNVDLVLRAADR